MTTQLRILTVIYWLSKHYDLHEISIDLIEKPKKY